MSFKFGCASDLYRRGLHPRLFCGVPEIKRLGQQVRTGLGRKIMHRLRRQLEPVKRRVLDSKDFAADMDFYGGGAWHSFAWTASLAVRDLALLGHLDGDLDAVEAARRIVTFQNAKAGFIDWGGQGAVAYDLMQPFLTAEQRREYTLAAEETVRRQVAAGLRAYYRNSGANTPIGENLAQPLLMLMAIEGEAGVGDLGREKKTLLSFLEATLHTVVNANGFPEEDTGYGTGTVAAVAWLVEVVRRAGLYDAYKSCPRYTRFGRAVLHFVQPWGEQLAMTGDHAPVFSPREFVLARLATETKDPTLLWLLETLSQDDRNAVAGKRSDESLELPLGKGRYLPISGLSLWVLDDLKKSVHPAQAKTPTAFRDTGRGIVSFRSGWADDATFVMFDGSQRSPSGQGHAHASAGHFSISALGEYFTIASGRYSIDQDQHNVVLIDGKSGRTTGGKWVAAYHDGLLTDYRPDVFCDTASADSSHQHNCYWAKRTLGLVKDEHGPSYVWTVDDINKANDWAEFWWQLHTSPENTITLKENGATIQGWRKGNCLDAHFALPAPSAYPRPHTLTMAQDEATVSSYDYIKNPHERVKEYARPAAMVNGIVFVRPRLLAKVAGYNGRFMSVLLPRKKNEKPATVERLESLDNSLAVRITFRGVEDTLIWAYEHHLLEAGDIQARGNWCVVRRSRATGKVLNYAIGDGTSLRVGRKTFL